MRIIKSLLVILAFVLSSSASYSQTWSRDYHDVFDTVWNNVPNAMTYTPGHGALISSSMAGSAGSWYMYNYMTHVNDKGDSVWVKRNILDTTYVISFSGDSAGYPVRVIDTVLLHGIVSSVARLPGNGNYLVAGKNWDTALPNVPCYIIKQFDSMGNYLSGYIIYDSIRACQRDVNVIAADNNNFYVVFNADSMYSIPPTFAYDSDITYCGVMKFHDNFVPVWSNAYHFGYTDSLSGAYIGDYGVLVSSAFLTAEKGLAFIRCYDTSMVTYLPINYLLKLNPDGTMAWQRNLQTLLGTGTPGYFQSSFATHDSCIVTIANTADSSYYNSVLLKLSSTGALLDTTNCTAAYLAGGVELSDGRLLFTSSLVSEFSFYDKNTNYLYSTPYPFAEFDGGSGVAPVANLYGGAMWAYSSDPYDYHNWHIVAVNFDSLFNCYPANISGNIYQDNNDNCVEDGGDLGLGGSVAHLHEAISGTDFYAFATTGGSYIGNVPLGNYTITHAPYGYERNECGAYTFSITTPATYGANNFADTLVPGINDLLLSLYSYCMVPGDTTELVACAINNGTTRADTTFTVLLDPGTTFVSSVPLPMAVSGDTLTFHINLLTDSVACFNIILAVSTSATIGDVLTFSSQSLFPDNVVTTDDSAVYTRAVASSFDPNSKGSNQPLYFHRDNTMIYTVGFQNTGTYLAKNIVVIDTLDKNVDPATFKYITSSGPKPTVSWKQGNRVYFTFNNINLPDSAANPAGSHGWFSYSIKAKSTVPDGDTIHNTANIFFDYNAAIVTNTTTNILMPVAALTTKVTNSPAMANVLLYPNPSTGIINIELPGSKRPWDVAIADVSGRIISDGTYNATSIQLNVTTGPGIYFVTITNPETQEHTTKKVVLLKD